MFKQIRTLSLLILIAGVIGGCTKFTTKPLTETSTEIQPTSSPTAETTQSAILPEGYFETFEFVADAQDKNVRQATERRATVELKEYDFGVMVEGLQGQRATKDHYWALYLNDEYALAGASQTELKEGDRVKWVFEEIQQGL